MSDSAKKPHPDEALQEAISPIVNRLIDRNFENSQDKIAEQIAPLIGKAIRVQIETQKDDVVDALYPVMGNMVSRYASKMFTQMLESINNKVQAGLSFNTVTRKIRARVKGVSESDLLVTENTGALIRAVLLIHRESGIVLSIAENSQTAIVEPEMLASMMSAIKSFVNDWVEKNSDYQELGEIEYGGSKIILESAGYCYMAVIIDGGASVKIYDTIRSMQENIVKQYGDEIRTFDGNLDNVSVDDIRTKMSALLQSSSENNKTKQKMHPLIYIAPALIIGWVGWVTYHQYQDDALSSKVNERIYKTPQLTSYRLSAESDAGHITLTGEVPLLYYKQLVSDVVRNVHGVKQVKNKIIAVSGYDNPMQISSNISYLLNGLNTDAGMNLTYEFNYPTVLISGTVWDQKRLHTVTEEIKKISGQLDASYNVEVTPPDIHEIIYFESNSYQISAENEMKLVALSKKLAQLDTKAIVYVEGYSDGIGSKNANKRIVDNRVKVVFDMLSKKLMVSQAIEISSHYEPPENIDVKTNPEFARFVAIRIGKEV